MSQVTGFLKKQGHLISSWKQRWFVLTPRAYGGAILAYYEDQNASKQKGEYTLTPDDFTVEVSADNGSNKFCFTLTLKATSATLLMSGSSEQDRDKWIGKIRELGNQSGDGTAPPPKKGLFGNMFENSATATQPAPPEDFKSLVVNFTKQQFEEFKHFVIEGHWSWCMLSLIAGVGLAFSGGYYAIESFLSFSIFQGLFDAFIAVFGVVMIALDYKETFLPVWVIDWLKDEFLFVYKPIGRAVITFFLGLLLFSEGEPLYFMVGLYTMVVGLMIFFAYWSAGNQFNAMKANRIDEVQLREYYSKAANPKLGYLTSDTLAVLCARLGTPLKHSELEVALLELDSNHDQQISWEEFKAWYQRQD